MAKRDYSILFKFGFALKTFSVVYKGNLAKAEEESLLTTRLTTGDTDVPVLISIEQAGPFPPFDFSRPYVLTECHGGSEEGKREAIFEELPLVSSLTGAVYVGVIRLMDEKAFAERCGTFTAEPANGFLLNGRSALTCVVLSLPHAETLELEIRIPILKADEARSKDPGGNAYLVLQVKGPVEDLTEWEPLLKAMIAALPKAKAIKIP